MSTERIDRVTQLEQALAHAREHIAGLHRRHEAAEQAWAKNEMRKMQENETLRERIAFLESCLTEEVVAQSKGVR
jgi:flagellar biosynthesis chaperone FliJ